MAQISLLILTLLGFPMLLEVRAVLLMPVGSTLVNLIRGSLPEIDSFVAGDVPVSPDELGSWGTSTHRTTETIDLDSLPTVTQQAALFIGQKLHLKGKPLAALP